MDELIQFLSLISEDQARRDKVSQVLRNKLQEQQQQLVAQQSNDGSASLNGASSSSDDFVKLFEERLRMIGDNVRLQAAAAATTTESSSPTTDKSKTDNEEQEQSASSSPPPPSEEAQALGKQLWALVDIMVQSKIIFKQAKKDGLL